MFRDLLMDEHDVLSWYESSLPLKERKRRGHFSTPPLLIEQMLDACGYIPEHDLTTLRVLDPACGSGNFLARAAQRLIASGRCSIQDEESLLALVQRNIWGLDPDPVACFLADMQLRTTLSVQHDRPFHIQQADGLTLPWEQCETIDLFFANPPYLAAKNNDLSGYQSTQRRGQTDSYLLFLDLALTVVRPGGWLALVLPDPVLARANATSERRRLLAHTTVHHLWHLSGVFAAQVGAVVLIAQKCSPPTMHMISWKREKWPSTSTTDNAMAHQVGTRFIASAGATKTAISEDVGGSTTMISFRVGSSDGRDKSDPYPYGVAPTVPISNHISQAILRNQQHAELRYLLPSEQDTVIARLHRYLCDPSISIHENERRFVPLGEIVTIRRGEELGKGSPLLLNSLPTDQQDYHPVLRGGVDVHAYASPTASCWIARDKLTKPLERYLAPKLLVVKSTARLQAALDLQGHVVLQTLYILSPRSHDTPLDEYYFLLALLNSQLLRDYVSVLHTAYKWVQPQIEQHVVAALPIPLCAPEEKADIVARAKHIMLACSNVPSVVELEEQIDGLYKAQERAICALYRNVTRE